MSIRDLLMAAASSAAPAYRYWRIYITANNGDIYFTGYEEIELRGAVGGVDLTNASTPVTESSYYPAGSNHGSKTVDNVGLSPWLSNIRETPPHWVGYDLLSPQGVAQIAIRPELDGQAIAPKNFIVQGSNDGTVFKDIKTFSGITAWTDNTFNLFNLD